MREGPSHRRVAWVLNLDADLELGAQASSPGSRAPRSGYTPSRSVRAGLASFVPVLARSLLGPEDVLVDESSPRGVAAGLPGRAFCPTPRALAILERAGAVAEPAPPLAVLRQVNSRAFASSLGTTLPGAAFVTDLPAALAQVAHAPPCGDAWRAKRAFGMTGRGQRVLEPTPTPADLAFVRAGIAEGGLQLEPNVFVAREYAIHGYLEREGALRLGRAVEQQCDARGAWLATRPFEPSNDDEQAIAITLREQAEGVAAALARAAYFGPFGVDAFSYRAPDGTFALQPRSEINARYGMGYAVGMSLPDSPTSPTSPTTGST